MANKNNSFVRYFCRLCYTVLSWPRNFKLQIIPRLKNHLESLPRMIFHSLPHPSLENIKNTDIRQKNSLTELSKKITAACNILIPSRPHQFILFWRRKSHDVIFFLYDYVDLSFFHWQVFVVCIFLPKVLLEIGS